jgi:hypothetical protein
MDFYIYLILPAALGPGVYPVSNRSTKRRIIIFLESRSRSMGKAHNITAIHESTVETMWDP